MAAQKQHEKPKKTVFCFGNIFIEEDAAAIKLANDLAKELPDFCFKTDCAPDDLIAHEADEAIILDAVKGITKAQLIKNIDLLQEYDKITMHDFDLGFFLKLIKEAGQVKAVKIIGIPMKTQLNKKVKEDVKNLLKNLR